MNPAGKTEAPNPPGKPRKDRVLFLTNLRFLLSFIFLIFFATGNFLVMHYEILQAERNTTILGFLEGQYGLVQKTTFLSLAYAQAIDYPERQNLRASIHEDLKNLLVFNTTSNDILAEKTRLPQTMVRTLRQLYFQPPFLTASLNEDVQAYFSGLKKFLMGSPIKVRSDNPQLLAFQSKSTKLLLSLRTTIQSFQKDGAAKIALLKNVGGILFALNFICLAAIGMLVFLPTLKNLGVYLRQLKNMNEALEVKVSERTVELEHKARQLGLTNEELREQIDKRVQIEKELRELSWAMENALDGIARLDPNKKFLSVNRSYAAMMGYAPEEMVDLNRMTTICSEDSDKAQRTFEEMEETGKSEAEVKAIRKDGSIFHQYVVLVKSVNKNQVFDGFYCFAKDVTEHKYQEALEIKAELIQMVSHELRTPIHSVKEGLNIVLEGLTGEITPEQREVLSISKRCVDRLVRLVNDVLAFHKLEAGVIEFHMKKENLSRMIADVGASMRPLVENKNLFLKLALQENLPEIELDHDKIIQVLTNFLQNAIKFTLQGGITVTSSADSHGVRISVKDTGIGVQQKDAPKLFRKFGQLESAKLIAPGGTGLGLAISKTIVERHHGKIEMESEYQKGSTFSFTLPLEQPRAKDAPQA